MTTPSKPHLPARGLHNPNPTSPALHHMNNPSVPASPSVALAEAVPLTTRVPITTGAPTPTTEAAGAAGPDAEEDAAAVVAALVT